MQMKEARPSGPNCGPSLIESYGQVFSEFLIEAVVDAKHPGRLSMESWNGRKRFGNAKRGHVESGLS